MTAERRRANLNPPVTIDEAEERLVYVKTEIETIEAHIAAGGPLKHDGTPLSDDEFAYWRGRALGAMSWYIRERSVVQAWIDGYQRDVRAEEERDRALERARLKAESARQQAEAARIKKEATERRQAEIRAREEAARQWAGTMLEKAGTTRIPPELIEANQVELRRLAEQRSSRLASKQMTEQRNSKRRQAHREWLVALEIDEPINGLDAENLLRHACRALVSLRKRGVEFTPEEQAVLNVIQQRELVRATLEDD